MGICELSQKKHRCAKWAEQKMISKVGHRFQVRVKDACLRREVKRWVPGSYIERSVNSIQDLPALS